MAASPRSARSPSPRTTSPAPVTPRPRSPTRSASSRRCCAAASPDGHVVAVIGDGALTGGVAFEALHNAGGMDVPIVIVLNDNGMSIAPNVGALSRYFNRVRLNPSLYRAREKTEESLTRLPAGIGERIERIGPQLKESIRSLWAPGLFFEELDLAYVGVIDGHDVGGRPPGPVRGAGGQPPGRRACAHRQGQGLRPGGGGRPRGDGGVARRQAGVDRRAPADGAAGELGGPAAVAVHRRLRTRPGRRVPPRRARLRDHRGDELRHRPGSAAEGDARPLLRCRHRRAARGAVRGRLGDRRVEAGRRGLLDVPAARLRSDRARRLPAEAQRRVRDGPRRARRRRRADASRRVRHFLSALPSEHRADGAARRDDARRHAAHGAHL